MKKGMIVLTCSALLATSLVAKGHHHRGHHYQDAKETQTLSTAANLTQEQEENLVFMYQEEKVARDAYITLGEEYNLKVFKNIQKSEQKHMDAVKGLLEKYNIPVPVIEDEIGVFENEELQNLYNQLVQQGLESKVEALKVGVLVEETDIADLEERMEDAPYDIQKVFGNLLRGSNNHLRAFNRVLDRTK